MSAMCLLSMVAILAVPAYSADGANIPSPQWLRDTDTCNGCYEAWTDD